MQTSSHQRTDSDDSSITPLMRLGSGYPAGLTSSRYSFSDFPTLVQAASHQRTDSDSSVTPLIRFKSEYPTASNSSRYSPSDFPTLVLGNDQPEAPAAADLKAWSTTIGGTLAAMATFGYTNAFGVYQDIYTRRGTASASRISWIGSTQMFFMLAMALPAGKLLDMGYFRQATLFGSVLYVFSLFMVSVVHTDQYYQIF
ncbi:hypothetical protein VKT23_009860 [Stygiomarasmius scandens]|uniref:Uncharacterized protein n=1 Tax=Marasmiellus scandens TaxID=2682957 RepID=A0ABR1JIS8_9AGAR